MNKKEISKQLDEKVLQTIVAHCAVNERGIRQGTIRANLQMLSLPEARKIDRSLQRLRHEGKIKFAVGRWYPL